MKTRVRLKYFMNDCRFNVVYFRNNLPKIKDGAYILNLNECKSIETHWVSLYLNCDNATYFDSFGV